VGIRIELAYVKLTFIYFLFVWVRGTVPQLTPTKLHSIITK